MISHSLIRPSAGLTGTTTSSVIYSVAAWDSFTVAEVARVVTTSRQGYVPESTAYILLSLPRGLSRCQSTGPTVTTVVANSLWKKLVPS